MKLKRVEGGFNVTVQCCKCGKIEKVHNTCADLHGKAFGDYYCLECVEMLKDELKNK